MELVFEAYAAPDQDAAVERLKAEAAALEGQLERLAEAIATAGSVPVLVGKLEGKQRRLETVRRELLALEGRQTARVDLRAFECKLRRRLDDWRDVLLKGTAEARGVLRQLLDGPLRFRPAKRDGREGYEFRGKLAIGPLVAGFADLPLILASPTGFCGSYRLIRRERIVRKAA